MNIIEIKANLTWLWAKSKNGFYVAVCPSLRQTVQSDTYSDMMETIGEVLNSTFTVLAREGELHNFLKKHGWSIKQREDNPPLNKARFDVPWEMKPSNRRDLQEALV